MKMEHSGWCKIKSLSEKFKMRRLALKSNVAAKSRTPGHDTSDFRLSLTFTEEYPQKPPTVTFVDK